MSRPVRFVSMVPWLLTSACAASAGDPPDQSPRTPAPAATAPSSSVTEVPKEVIAKARASLAQQVGAQAADSARVLTAEQVMWPNGAMGCPQPGRMYTQALVPGYRVVFDAGGQEYAYHASRTGDFKYCRQPAPPAGPAGQQVR
jgi:hypothetical protein